MWFTTCLFALVVIAATMALGGTGRCLDGRRLRDRLLARRGLRRAETTLVAAVGSAAGLLASGRVKLAGTTATEGGALIAPFSGRPCVAYELTLFDFHGVRPVLLAREVVARPFLLRDASGVAEVRPTHARIGIEPDRRWHFSPQELDERIAAILARHGAGAAGWRDHGVVVCEGVIGLGDEVAVLGEAAAEPCLDSTLTPYREAGLRPVLRGSREAPLLLASLLPR